MCSWIVEKAEMSGVAKGPDGWMDIKQANVYFDHPFKAPMDHALIIDFVRPISLTSCFCSVSYPEFGCSARICSMPQPSGTAVIMRLLMSSVWGST